MRIFRNAVLASFAVLLGVLFLTASIPNVPTETWQTWNAMTDARSGAPATLLSDGRVLIAGGADANGPTASADLFGTDGVFSPAAAMNSPRSNHTATLLGDGRVLVTGGETGSGVTNSAEVYDPAAGSWTLLGATMLDARAGHTASLLPDGRVLLAGGHNSGGALSSLEIFDPLTDDFTSAGTLTAPRMNHSAAVLGDGRVLAIGGTADGTNPLATIDIYDPITRTVGIGPSLSTPRMSATATTTLDGKVAVIGGSNGSQDLASAEVFDPATGQIAFSTSGLATPRSVHSAFLLPNNNAILIVGGTSGGTDLNSAELYFPWADSFQTTGAMSVARAGMTGSASGMDGRFLAAGGTNLASTELYGFATLKTDKNDYAPGEVVTITGSGWQPGETVTLTLTETPPFDTHPAMTAVADANGNIVNTDFSPDVNDLAIRFYLTATGSRSQAQTTFTDANRQLSIVSFAITSPAGAVDRTMNVSQPFNVHLVYNKNGGTWPSVTGTLTVPAGWTKSTDLSVTNLVSNADQTFDWTVTPSTTAGGGTISVSLTGIPPSGDSCNQCPFSSNFTVTSVNPALLSTTSMTAAKTVGGGTTAKTGDAITVTMVVANGAALRATANTVAASTLTVNTTGTATANCGASATAAANIAAGANRTYTYSCSITGGNGTVSFTGSANGTDENTAGAVGTGPNSTNSITVDNLAPAAPSTPDLDPASDSGTSSSDDITNDNTPTFTGTAEANVSVQLFRAGTTSLGTTTADGSGNWSLTASTIPDGTYSITAKATDAAGNVSPASGALSITIDTVSDPPSTPDLDTVSDSGSASTDNITNVNKPKFNGTAEKNASVELFRGGTISLGTTTADGSGNWNLTLATALADGTYSITAKATDVLAGNPVSAASGALSITIDTLAPAVSEPNLSPSDDNGISNTDNITNKTTNLSFSGSTDPSVAVELFEGATSRGTTTSNSGSGNWSITTATTFGEGSHIFTAKATDASGNIGTSAPHTVVIDITKPNVTINQAAGQADPAVVGPIHFTVVFNEAAFGFATGDVTLSGTAGATTATVTPVGVGGTNYDVSVTGMTTAGTVIASIPAGVATDTAGNGNNLSTSTDNSVLYNPDNKAPVVTITFSAVDGLGGWYVHSPVLGTVSADDTTTGNSNVSAISCTDGVNPLPVGSPTGIGTHVASGSLSVSGEGTHNISCQATDSAGNSGAFTGSTNTATIKIDTVAPSLTATRLTAANGNGWNNTDVSVRFACTDSTSLVASVNATGAATGSSTTSPLDVIVTSEGASQSVNGSCKDNAGNSATSASITDIKIDKTKPLITGGRTPAANANGWNNTDVTVNFTCADTGSVQSGMDIDTVAGQTLTAEVLNASVTNTGSCVDKAGNSADSATVNGINIDKTAPNAPTAVRTPAANGVGWSNTDVTVSFSSNGDSGAVQSGIDSCTTGSSLTAETSGTDVSGTCTDRAGNTSAIAKVTVKIDKTKPVITGSRNPAANIFGWNNTDVTVSFACAEAGSVMSGIATDTVAGATVMTEGEHQSVTNTGSCVDVAGNAAVSATVNEINIDKTAPNAPTAVRTPAANGAGWNNTDVTVSFTSNGDFGAVQSGIDTCTTSSSLTAETSGTDVSGTCTDKAGNTSAIAKVTLKIDKTKPVITGGRNPAANIFGWNNTDVTVSFACAEAGAVQSGVDTNSVAGQTVTGEVENLSVSNTGSCTDVAGNVADSASVGPINIDRTAPNAPTGHRSPNANLAGWNNTSPVAVSFTDNADAGSIKSGIDTCTALTNVTSETAGTDVNGTCTDKAGNTSAPFKVTVKIDLTKPVITGNRNPAPNIFGWNNVNVTVGFTCADTGAVQSGIATSTVAGTTVSTEGEHQSVTNTGSCVDVADNPADSATVHEINIDKTKPTASAAANPGPNTFGWNNSDVTVTFTGNDGLSGIAGCEAPVTLTSEGMNQSASGTCKDKADNVSDAASATGINIDKTKPVITGSRTPLANSYGWNNTDVTVSFTCADAGSPPSGIATNTAAGATLSGEGAGQFVTNTGYCKDKADNVADSSTVSGINIDKTNPTITLTITPGSPAVTGWYNISTGKPTVSFTCNDSLAGVASCTSPVLVGEGANQTISGTAMDKAGNSASTSIMHVNVDVTAPTINLVNPANSGSYLLNQSAAASYSCADTGSSGLAAGSAGCGGPVASGLQFDTASVGSKNFTVNAKDVAGNMYSKTSLYGVFYSTGACLGSPGHAILQPIDFTGASVFPKKQGSTVPAKFRVCDANGISIGTPGVVTDFKIIQIYNGTIYNTANEDPVSTTPDTMFRWSGDQWIFNISTKPLNAGTTYYYRISLNDGTFIDFDFGLK